MRSRLLPLLIVTLVVVSGAIWLSRSRAPLDEASAESLLPDLRGAIGNISGLRIVGAGGRALVTIERDAHGYVVVDRNRFRADTASLRGLLLLLSEARRIETKTSRPDRHKALGVESVAGKDATGVRLELTGLAQPVAVTVGRTADGLGGGTFVRLGDSPQSWLVSGNLVIARDPAQWLEKRVVDIAPERIIRIEVRDGDERFVLLPVGGNDAATDAAPVAADAAAAVAGLEPPTDALTDAPRRFVIEGVEVAAMSAGFSGEATAGVLQELDLVDVRLRTEAPAPRSARELSFDLRNGVRITAHTWSVDDKTLMQLSAQPIARAAAVEVPEAEAEVDTESGVSPVKGSEQGVAADTAAIAAAEAFDGQWRAWTYTLPPHRAAGLTATRASLLQPTEPR